MGQRWVVVTLVFVLLFTIWGASGHSGEVCPRDAPTLATREAWRGLLRWPQSCEDGFACADLERGGIAFYSLGRDHCLVQVACGAGAYQGYHMYYLLDEGRSPVGVTLLAFPSFEDGGQRAQPLRSVASAEVWGVPRFDPTTGRLTVLNRYRALGDCGTVATYEFEQGDVRVTELRAKRACDGRGAQQPMRWPRLKPR